MYYIIYGSLYLFSLIPFFIIYRISDAVYVLLYYILGYRKAVVMNNLSIAFPEKTMAERTRIAKDFYKGFVDTFIETIKLLSMTDKGFEKRCEGDFSRINDLAATGVNIQLLGGHEFNWEYINLLLSKEIKIPFIGVVANIENKALNRIYFKFRARYGTILIPNSNFQRRMAELMQKQYSLCLLADQNTAPERAWWLNFFGKPVPFIMGPHKAIMKFKPAVVYFNVVKLRRGYYRFEVNEIVENVDSYTPESLALKYRDHLEFIVRNQPGNYLWSHRRWKHNYREEYSKNWIDTDSPPADPA